MRDTELDAFCLPDVPLDKRNVHGMLCGVPAWVWNRWKDKAVASHANTSSLMVAA